MRGVWGGIRTGGGGGINGREMGGYGDEDRGGARPESGGYRDGVGGGISWGCEGGQCGKGRGRGRGVGDTDGKGVSGNEGAVTKLLPGDVLDVLVRLGTTPAWACWARRGLGASWTACIPAIGRSLVSASAKTVMPEETGGGGGHVPHATGQVVRAME